MLWGLRPVEQLAAYGLVVERIRRQILLSLLLPGERLLPERKLAFEMNISCARCARRCVFWKLKGLSRCGVEPTVGTAWQASGTQCDRPSKCCPRPGAPFAGPRISRGDRDEYHLFRRPPKNADRHQAHAGRMDAILGSGSMSELRRAENTFHIALAESSSQRSAREGTGRRLGQRLHAIWKYW